MDHPDRRARACTARLFRSRPLLDRPHVLGIRPSGTRRAAFLRDYMGVDLPRRPMLLARPTAASMLPRLGGMARPNGVVIVSERYWAFATKSGELHEGAMPVRRSRRCRIPLVRGLLQLAALDGAARPRPRRCPRFVNASFCSPRCCCRSLRRAARAGSSRRRDPDDGADHPLALPRPHAAPARRRAPRDRGGRGTARSRRRGRRGATDAGSRLAAARTSPRSPSP